MDEQKYKRRTWILVTTMVILIVVLTCTMCFIVADFFSSDAWSEMWLQFRGDLW
jgi:hypothetical protein